MTIARDYEADFDAWCARRKAVQQARRAARALRMIRVRVLTPLPMAGVWMRGPKWKRAFHLTHLPLATVDPGAAALHGPGVKFWWYDFEDDVRELACEQIRFHVYAMWGGSARAATGRSGPMRIRPTGSFLRACLENDLCQAAMRADDQNRFCLAEIVLFLYRCCPERAWGSPARVTSWLADPTPVALSAPATFK